MDYFDGVALVLLVVVVVSVLVLVPDDGDEPVAGLEVVLLVSFVVELLDEELLPPAGDGFTTVVLFSVLLPGDAAGVAVSVFCSHAAKSAALARMQMYFFIGFGCSCPTLGQTLNRRKACLRSCGSAGAWHPTRNQNAGSNFSPCASATA